MATTRVPGANVPAGSSLDDPGALDPGHLGHIAPGAAAEVALGMVEAECFDPDQHLAFAGHWVRQLRFHQYLRLAITGNDNCPHYSAAPFDSRLLSEDHRRVGERPNPLPVRS